MPKIEKKGRLKIEEGASRNWEDIGPGI